MKIKWGALVVDGRGKLGGHVASQNKGGSYLRTKVTPSNPQTEYQSDARQLFGSISQAWSGLSASAILAWNAAAAEWSRTNVFGDIKIPSGKALFQRLNNQAQSAGYSAVTSVPAKLDMVQGVLNFANMAVGAGEITLNGVYTGADARLMVFATPPVSAGTTFVKNKLRFIDSQLGSTYDETAVYSAYANRFGAPSAGDKVYIGVKYVLPNGQASTLQVTQTIVDA